MLPSSQRLSVEQFKAVMKDGRIAHSPLFMLRIKDFPSEIRISAVVSKKIAKKAVQRNKIRRKVYNSLINLLPHFKNGHFIVFSKQDISNKTLSELTDDLRSVFDKSGVLK